ncbi:MAG: response regulator [Deltaproteobacteria bacterium]|nr:response regulator [Deltaproteobacteria bacterium]
MEQYAKVPHYRSLKRLLIAMVTLLILLLTGFSVWKSVVEYRLTVRSAELLTSGYARALKEHAERAFSEADNILLNAIDHLREHGGIDGENSPHLRAFLTRHPRSTPQIGAIILVNRKGLLFAHSLDAPVKQANVSDREYFLHHRDHPEDTSPFLSRPIKSRINGKWRFTLSRAVRSPSGQFEGLVAVAFEMEYFQNFYKSLDLGEKGRFVILRKDGVLLLAVPFNEKDFNVDFSTSYLLKTYLPKAPKGTYHIAAAKALLDKTPRIISYESLISFPVVVNANVGTDEVTASWRENAYKQAVWTLLVSCVLILLLILLLRQMKEIKQAYRSQAEQQAEVASAAAVWQTTFDSVTDAIWVMDIDRNILRCNKSTERVFGRSADQIVGCLCCEVAHQRPDPLAACPFQRMIDSRQRAAMQFNIEDRWFEVSVDPIFSDSGEITGAVHIVSDITAHKLAENERDQMEMQLRQAQKMEAIGHLAGGIAHDFNNLLTPIMGYAEMAAAKIPEGDPLALKLSGIISAANKARALTKQLLGFSRRQSITPEAMDLNEVIQSFEDIIRRTILESIRIELLLDPEGAFIKGDRSQIEQIILNLTVNAQDAFDGAQGRINIETSRIRMDEEQSRRLPGMTPGEYVLLLFRDNGCGMSAEVINHIFEPFFTTKKAGHGTGLGLATVYGIVKQHNAHISVTSHEGAGTTFKIYFPLCSQAPPAPEKTEISSHAKAVGEVTILIVEDNDTVREMVTEMLAGFVYKVLAAADAQKAMELSAQQTGQIDLLVSDVVMPGMNGPELYELLLLQRPSLKVVFISGYPVNPSLRDGTVADNFKYLQKPFTTEALLERINLVL